MLEIRTGGGGSMRVNHFGLHRKATKDSAAQLDGG